MNRKGVMTIGIVTVWLAVFTGLVMSAPDKYTVKVPGGLAFSEFRGYEAWQTISISRNEKVVAVILGNPVMINAYQAGIPANGKPVPDGCARCRSPSRRYSDATPPVRKRVPRARRSLQPPAAPGTRQAERRLSLRASLRAPRSV
jgi:hypothetical protein